MEVILLGLLGMITVIILTTVYDSVRAWLSVREENLWRESVGMPKYKRNGVHSTHK